MALAGKEDYLVRTKIKPNLELKEKQSQAIDELEVSMHVEEASPTIEGTS